MGIFIKSYILILYYKGCMVIFIKSYILILYYKGCIFLFIYFILFIIIILLLYYIVIDITVTKSYKIDNKSYIPVLTLSLQRTDYINHTKVNNYLILYIRYNYVRLYLKIWLIMQSKYLVFKFNF